MKTKYNPFLAASIAAVAALSSSAFAVTYTYSGAQATMNQAQAPVATYDTINFNITSGYFGTFGAKSQTYANPNIIVTGMAMNNGWGEAITTFSSATTFTGSGAISLITAGLAQDFVFAGNMTGYTGNISMAATGNATLTLGNTGSNIVQFGGTTAGGTTALGTVTGTSPNRYIDNVSGTGTFSGNNLVFNYAANAAYDYLRVTNSTIAVGKSIAFIGSANIESNSIISGAGELVKQGTGTLTLTSTNSYTGLTTITGGTLALGHATNTIANAAAITINGGTLAIGANSDTVGTVTLTSGSITGTGGTLTGSSYAVASGTISAKLDGTGTMNKTTSGTVTLSGANTYSGATTVSDGVLNLTGSLTSAISVTTGTGKISGSGSTTGMLTMAAGSGISLAGGGTTTSLTSNGVTFSGATTASFLTAPVAATNYDVLTFGSGTVTNPVNLSVFAHGTLTQGATKFSFLADGTQTRTWNTTTGTWANGTPLNFAEGDQKYFDGDSVVFSTIASDSAITLSGNLAPTAVSVSNAANTYTFSGGSITGASTLAKSGAGGLTLSVANSYSGGTTIGAGTVTTGNATALGSGTVTLTGGSLNLGSQTIANAIAANGGSLSGTGTASGTITGAVVVNTAGTITFNNQKAYTGGTTIDAGILDLTGGGGLSGAIRGTATVNTNGTLRLSTGDATGYGTDASRLSVINLVGGTLDVNTTSNQTLGSATINMTGGSITGIAGSNLDFFANGSAINTLASANESTISLPTMNLRQDNTAFDIANGAATNDLVISSIIGNGAQGNHAMIKNGAGTMQLTGVNTFTGDVTVNNGVLEVSGTGRLYNPAYNNTNVVTVNTNGTLRLSSFEYNGSLGQLADYGVRRVINGGTIEVTGASHSSGNNFNVGTNGGTFRYNPTTTTDTLTLSGNANSNIANAGALTLQADGNISVGEVIEGAGSIVKTGTKTLTLSGANTYTGTTTVSAGTLAVNGSLANTSTTVGNTGTLQGSGSTVGSVTVQSGGTLAPGNSIESLGVGSLALESSSTFAYELNSAIIGGDLIYSTGTLSIANGTTLTLNELFSGILANDTKLTLISYTGGWTGGGAAAGLFTYLGNTLTDDACVTLGSNQWKFDYNDTTGGSNFTSNQAGATNFVTMTVIPEPNVAALLGGLGMLALLRRRR